MGKLNLSYESLTSQDAMDALNKLKRTDQELYLSLTSGDDVSVDEDEDTVFPEDQEMQEDELGDDSSLSLKEVIAATMNGTPPDELDPGEENIDSSGDADSDEPTTGPITDGCIAGPSTRSGRIIKVPHRYASASWCKFDDASSDEEPVQKKKRGNKRKSHK